MSKILRDEQYWVNYHGVTIKYTFKWWVPFKKLWLKASLFLADNMDLIYTYDAETGATADVKQRVWSRENGVELSHPAPATKSDKE